jgi:hypothetical protein
VPNLDAIQEFQAQTSNYTARIRTRRRSRGQRQHQVWNQRHTRHGARIFRHDIFDARDAFDYFDRSGDGKADPNALQQHQFGFTLGGPIGTVARSISPASKSAA